MGTFLILVMIIAAFGAGIIVSYRSAREALATNRSQWENFKSSGRLDPEVTDWLRAHIRDDVAGILAALFLTNGLLAAILAALVVNIIR